MNIKSSYKREKMQNENNDKKKNPQKTVQQGHIIDTIALKRSALPKSSVDFDVRWIWLQVPTLLGLPWWLRW